jgi:hypothetical protein
LQSNASRPTPHPHQAPHPTNRDRAADASRLQRPGPDDHHDHNDQDENAARISNCAITRTHTHTPKERKQPSRIDRCSDSVRKEAKDGEASGCWLLAAGCWLTGSPDLLPGLDATATAAGEGGAWPVAKACWVASCCAATEGSSICPCGRSSTSDAASANCHATRTHTHTHTHTHSERASDDAECGTMLVSAAAAHSRSGGGSWPGCVVLLCYLPFLPVQRLHVLGRGDFHPQLLHLLLRLESKRKEPHVSKRQQARKNTVHSNRKGPPPLAKQAHECTPPPRDQKTCWLRVRLLRGTLKRQGKGGRGGGGGGSALQKCCCCASAACAASHLAFLALHLRPRLGENASCFLDFSYMYVPSLSWQKMSFLVL